MNPLQQLHSEYGQSIWLDFISRKLLDSGELARLANAGEIRGVTSNPAIFEKSISEGVDYAPFISELRAKNSKATAFEVYEALAVRDIQTACDVLAPLYAARTEVGMKFDEIREKDGLGAALRWRAAQFAD